MTENTNNRQRPFSNGGQFMDWCASNCDRCVKSFNDGGECDIEEALFIASIDDGTVSEDIARRMGYLKPDGTTSGAYGWPCTEVEWTEDWKAHVLAGKREG
jgi:hypothetical protein